MIAVLAAFGGCVTGANMQGVMALKRLGEEQNRIEGYVKRQSEGFLRLYAAAREGRLSTGVAREEISRSFAEPVLCRALSGEQGTTECLYRRPTEYFSREKVYLVFAEDGSLASYRLGDEAAAERKE